MHSLLCTLYRPVVKYCSIAVACIQDGFCQYSGMKLNISKEKVENLRAELNVVQVIFSAQFYFFCGNELNSRKLSEQFSCILLYMLQG